MLGRTVDWKPARGGERCAAAGAVRGGERARPVALLPGASPQPSSSERPVNRTRNSSRRWLPPFILTRRHASAAQIGN